MHESRHNQADAAGEPDDHTDISLRPYIDTLRGYSSVIGFGAVAVLVVFMVGVLALLILYPSERTASLGFRLLFDGAALQQYPNKRPFNPEEVVAVPVVTEVFKTNNLQQYGTVDDFKGALSVQQSNPRLDQIAYEYQARLSDPRLTSVDRSRIETEYNQKRQAVNDPTSYTLTLRRSERFRTLPNSLTEKVLRDTLAAWAVHADRNSTALCKLQLPLLARLVPSKEQFDREDYLAAIALLNARASRVIDTVSELQRMPGAFSIRTSTDGISLSEIRTNVEEALHFHLAQLPGIIKLSGVTKDPHQFAAGASAQAFELSLDIAAAEERMRAIETSLAAHEVIRDLRSTSRTESGTPKQPGAKAPSQVSESSLDSPDQLLTTQQADLEYRRKLTDMIIQEATNLGAMRKQRAYSEAIVKAIQGSGNRPAGSQEFVAYVEKHFQAALSVIAKSADQLADWCGGGPEAQTSSPATPLYAVTTPFVTRSEGALSIPSVAASFVLTVILTLAVLSAGCLVHNAMKGRRSSSEG